MHFKLPYKPQKVGSYSNFTVWQVPSLAQQLFLGKNLAGTYANATPCIFGQSWSSSNLQSSCQSQHRVLRDSGTSILTLTKHGQDALLRCIFCLKFCVLTPVSTIKTMSWVRMMSPVHLQIDNSLYGSWFGHPPWPCNFLQNSPPLTLKSTEALDAAIYQTTCQCSTEEHGAGSNHWNPHQRKSPVRGESLVRKGRALLRGPQEV